MLSFVPDSFLLGIIHLILAVGVVGSLVSFFLLHRLVRWFPALAPYHLLIQIVSIALLVLGVYFKGGFDTEASWREKVRIAEEKARIAEEQARVVNEVVVTKYRDKVKTIKEQVIVYQDRIKEVEKVIDKDCKVAPQVVDIHNDAAKNVKKETTK